MQRFFRLLPVTLSASLSLLSLAQPARADACFGGGPPPPEPQPSQDAGPDGNTEVDARSSKPTHRYAGGGLVFLAGLASIWMSARRGDRRSPPRNDRD